MLARDVLTFDCEWVPDVVAGRRLYDLKPARLIYGPDSTNGEAIDYEGWQDEDVIDRMFRENKQYDEKENPRPFLKPILCQVVSIATVRRLRHRDGRVETTLKVVERDTEADRIAAFLEGIGKLKPQIVGYNSKSADLPILIQRALVNRLQQPDFCKRPDKPWEGIDYFAKDTDWHVDLLFQLAGNERKSAPTLSEACAALDILGGGKDIDGGDVLDLFLAGDFTTINRYCATDVVRQHLLFLRLCVLAGFISPDDEVTETASLVEQLLKYTTAPEGSVTTGKEPAAFRDVAADHAGTEGGDSLGPNLTLTPQPDQ